MSDHNAARQAREELTAKAEDIAELEGDKEVKSKKMVKKDDLMSKIDLLTKSLDGEEVVSEEVVAEVPAEVVESVVEVAEEVAPVVEETEKAKKVEDKEEEEENKEEKCTKTEEVKEEEVEGNAEKAVAKLTTFLLDNLVPMLKSLQKDVSNLSDSVAKSQSITKSFHEDSFAKAEDIVDLKKTMNMIAGTVELIAKSAQPRKSLASFVAMEKSFSNEAKDESFEGIVTKKMDEGMSLAEAMTFAKSQK